MAVQADRNYKATVSRVTFFTSTRKGTPGLLIEFDTEDGPVGCTRWITPRTADRVRDDLLRLGANAERLVSRDYMEGTMIEDIAGHVCDVKTEMDDYNEKVVVRWINDLNGPAPSGDAAGEAAYLFGGPKPKAAVVPPAEKGKIDDDDLPF